MKTPWQWNRRAGWQVALDAVILFVFALALVWLLTACVTTQPGPTDVKGVPNFKSVTNGSTVFYRSGQPRTPDQWLAIRSLGVSNVIKLNEQDESPDALPPGMVLRYYPVDTMQQLVDGPDPAKMREAMGYIGPGTLVHCEHGQDRTGVLVYIYRVSVQHWSPEAARLEMMTNGFHSALGGLDRFVRNWKN